MKRTLTLGLALALALATVPTALAADFDASKFPAWVESDGLWRTVVRTSFKDGTQYAPSEKDLKTIMRLASLTPTSTGKTDYLLVVLTDPAQQLDVVGKDNANSGTITVLVFGDRLLPTNQSVGKHTQSVSLGYGTHFYMSTPYGTKDARTMTIEDAYLKGKGYKYTLGADPQKQGDAQGQVEAYGNLKFVCAIVIGTLDEKAQSKVTDKKYPENWVLAK